MTALIAIVVCGLLLALNLLIETRRRRHQRLLDERIKSIRMAGRELRPHGCYLAGCDPDGRRVIWRHPEGIDVEMTAK